MWAFGAVDGTLRTRPENVQDGLLEHNDMMCIWKAGRRLVERSARVHTAFSGQETRPRQQDLAAGPGRNRKQKPKTAGARRALQEIFVSHRGVSRQGGEGGQS